MSEMTANAASDDTLIRDSQLSGFSAFKERLGFCCCRLLNKTSNYNLTSIPKDVEQQPDKPTYINQAYQAEKQQRNVKLEKIAKTLPGATLKGTQGIQTPISVGQTPTRSLTTITQGTPRSTIPSTPTRAAIPSTPTRSAIPSTPTRSATITKPGISTINRPSPLPVNTKNNKKAADEISTGWVFNQLKFFEKRNFYFLFR
jgi:hypothetical protein